MHLHQKAAMNKELRLLTLVEKAFMFSGLWDLEFGSFGIELFSTDAHMEQSWAWPVALHNARQLQFYVYCKACCKGRTRARKSFSIIMCLTPKRC